MSGYLETGTHATHIVVAGDASDIPSLCAVLDGLAPETYGQVFIEIDSARQMVPIAVPARVAVTWLRRDLVYSEVRGAPGAVPGEALTRAVTAWVAEWMPADDPEGRYGFDLRIGYSASACINSLYRRLGVRPRLPGVGF